MPKVILEKIGGQKMVVKATITIDDDRWAKHPYGVEFSDKECDAKYGRNGLNNRDECYRSIESAKRGGYDVDSHVDERFY